MVCLGTIGVDCLLRGNSGFLHILEQELPVKHSVRSPLENTRGGIPGGAYWGDSSPWRQFPKMMLFQESYFIIGRIPQEDVSLCLEKTLPHFLGIRFPRKQIPSTLERLCPEKHMNGSLK